jgi:hypothetical protein
MLRKYAGLIDGQFRVVPAGQGTQIRGLTPITGAAEMQALGIAWCLPSRTAVSRRYVSATTQCARCTRGPGEIVVANYGGIVVDHGLHAADRENSACSSGAVRLHAKGKLLSVTLPQDRRRRIGKVQGAGLGHRGACDMFKIMGTTSAVADGPVAPVSGRKR